MSDIRLIQLNNYIRPKIEENKSKDWVLNGRNNSFYQYIIDRRNGSPTNASILQAYTNLTYGQGIKAKNASTNTTDWVKFVSLLSKKDLRNIVDDFCMFGECAMQVVKTKDRKDIAGIYHLPINKIAPQIANEDDEIEGYWYCKDWTKYTKYEPTYYPTFGTTKDEIEIYVVKPYKAGKEYFSDPDYIAGLPYAEMEEEIANYYISHIRNGLSFGYIINIPDGNSMTPEEKDILERKIKDKLTGSSNAGKFVLSFNGRDAEITVTPITVNDAHKQWQYLTQEARQQLLTAHMVTSPMLFGIKDNTGFGNNADELDTAEAQLVKRVIQPKQNYILDALDDITNFYNMNLQLYFKPLTELPQATTQLSTHVCCSEKKKTDLDDLLDKGEVIDLEEYDLVHEIEVDYEEEEKFSLASTGVANPNAKSEQDNKDIIIRYRYTGSSSPEREFCQKMMSAGKVYRKEDIIAMENRAVNAGWGPNGANTYSIWLYKGGANCYHQWFRLIYVKKGVKIDVNSPLSEQISTSEARRRGYKVPVNDTLVSIKPINMPNQGFLPK
jgi:hypothetical protein